MRRRRLIKTSLGLTVGLTLANGLKACSTEPAAEAPATDAAESESKVSDAKLTVVQGGGFPNSLDLHRVGTNRPAYGLSWAMYDRLMTFGKKDLPMVLCLTTTQC
jgi:peptide/nickel transport system substrate-binding protein